MQINDMIALKDLKKNETGVITEIRLGGHMKRRLTDMGITEGALVTMLRTAPLGDPIELRILGFRLCIRKKDAARIFIERIGSNNG